eukprot:jgi/Botrbrau1/2429/Bobra.0395s0051.1
MFTNTSSRCSIFTVGCSCRTPPRPVYHQVEQNNIRVQNLSGTKLRASGNVHSVFLTQSRRLQSFSLLSTHERQWLPHRTCKAGPDERQSEGTPEVSTSEDAEARLEAFERGVKRKKGAQTVVADARLRSKRNESESTGLAEWKEGQLFPEGWDGMPLPQKLYELYTGKRGFLYWTAQAAWYSIFGLVGGWVVFRFVLPALGIYQLANDLQSPPNL